MSDPTRKVSPNEAVRVRAPSWNDAMSAARAYRHSLLDGGAGGPFEAFPLHLIEVKNDSVGVIPRFGVLKLGDAVTPPDVNLHQFGEQIMMKGYVPDGGDKKWCITLQPLIGSEIGKALVSGPCLAWVNVTDANHTHAAPATGDIEKLASGTSGALILYKPSGTGNLWCYVLLPAAAGGGFVLRGSDVNTGLYYTSGTVTQLTVFDDSHGGVYNGQDTGLRVADDGGSATPRLVLLAATTSNGGAVTAEDQELTGDKGFRKSVVVRAASVGGLTAQGKAIELRGTGPANSTAGSVHFAAGLVSSNPVGIEVRAHNAGGVAGPAIDMGDNDSYRIRIHGYDGAGALVTPILQVYDQVAVAYRTGQTTTQAGLQFVDGILVGGSFNPGGFSGTVP